MSLALPVVADVAWFRVDDAGAAGTVRRAASALGARLGLSDERVGELAILAAELASNLYKHAEAGQVLLRSLRRGDDAGVGIVALDAGPGMANAELSRVDGHSTTGTLGIGLGAIGRLATSSDLYSLPGRGTVVTAEVWAAKVRGETAAVDGLSRPMSGESVSGDAWSTRLVERLQVMVCDGLGHGPLAAHASQTAVTAFREGPAGGPVAVVEHLHSNLGRTRGGALAVAEFDPDAGTLRFAGLGNIAGHLVRPGGAALERTGLVSLPGIAGHQRRTVREFTYPVEPGDLVVLHSDGVTDKWRLGEYPGLAMHTPLAIAATLLRDAGVRRDDATVVVVRVPSTSR
ncbi:SpoIIE family protein phosphatase [Planosporangium flavigriseum]|uniref:Transcriptional regulator n=1 Tax=Planosporangium flavigriseum TaxID=373681 RepID=A0A8J3LRJ6_9ACTN|nr:SpoIIE family protein phosphatase [Planosporangium flavigriseum]GIG75313.1 transcriptional regulator [Planosporangium flavigriseum]